MEVHQTLSASPDARREARGGRGTFCNQDASKVFRGGRCRKTRQLSLPRAPHARSRRRLGSSWLLVRVILEDWRPPVVMFAWVSCGPNAPEVGVWRRRNVPTQIVSGSAIILARPPELASQWCAHRGGSSAARRASLAAS